MGFDPIHAVGTNVIEYKVGERIDTRTFNASVTFAWLGQPQAATIQFYSTENNYTNVNHVTNLMQRVNNNNIIKLLYVDVKDGYMILVFSPFFEKFNTWLRWNKPIWEYNNDESEIIAMGSAFTDVFRAIVDSVKYLHYNGLYHGNLRKGVTVSINHTIQLTDFTMHSAAAVGQNQDLEDLVYLVRRVAARSSKRGSQGDPMVLQLFFEIPNLFTNQLRRRRNYVE